MVEFRQTDFSGGMNLFSEDHSIGGNEYALAHNVRNRTGSLSAVYSSTQDTTVVYGKKQGLYSFDDYIIIFVDGMAYYKDITKTDSTWIQVEDFVMDFRVDYIYAEAVPQSKNNFSRKLQEEERIDGSSAETNVDTTPERISITNSGLVCQDGKSQPRFITPTADCVKLQTYEQWTLEKREYVPIMKQMKYINGILFGVDPDGVTLYRSVSGRPLDFVVNIDIKGDKGGDAKTTSYNVAYSPITCLASLNSGELFVATTRSCHPVEFNYDKTIFAEPTFLNRRTFAASVVNQFSFIDRLGDYCFIDFDGIRSYNAVASNQNEGRNSIFSRTISKAFSGVRQEVCCAIVYDNYSLFAVDTIYGHVLAVFDNTRETWVSFDLLDVDGPIKQMAVANQGTAPILYAITEASLYSLYTNVLELQGKVWLKSITTGEAKSNIRLPRTYITFDGGTTEAVAQVEQFVNNKYKSKVATKISRDSDGQTDATLFNDTAAKQGWKVQVAIAWQNEAKIAVVQCMGEQLSHDVAVKQRAQVLHP